MQKETRTNFQNFVCNRIAGMHQCLKFKKNTQGSYTAHKSYVAAVGVQGTLLHYQFTLHAIKSSLIFCLIQPGAWKTPDTVFKF